MLLFLSTFDIHANSIKVTFINQFFEHFSCDGGSFYTTMNIEDHIAVMLQGNMDESDCSVCENEHNAEDSEPNIVEQLFVQE